MRVIRLEGLVYLGVTSQAEIFFGFSQYPPVVRAVRAMTVHAISILKGRVQVYLFFGSALGRGRVVVAIRAEIRSGLNEQRAF